MRQCVMCDAETETADPGVESAAVEIGRIGPAWGFADGWVFFPSRLRWLCRRCGQGLMGELYPGPWSRD